MEVWGWGSGSGSGSGSGGVAALHPRLMAGTPPGSAIAQALRPVLAKWGVEFEGETLDTSVCHMAFFRDPDGNALMLHRRYAPRS